MKKCQQITRFHASGGATRPTLCVEQLLAALVRSVAIPLPPSHRTLAVMRGRHSGSELLAENKL